MFCFWGWPWGSFFPRILQSGFEILDLISTANFAAIFLELCGAFFVGVRWTLRCFFCGGQMNFGVLFLWGSDGTLGCFFCGGQMDFGVLFLWGSDGLWGAFFVGVRWTLGCFFCGGQMDFGVLFFAAPVFNRSNRRAGKKNLAGSLVFGVLLLWGSDGLCGSFFCGGQMDFAVLFLWGSDDFAVLFLWLSDGLCGAFFCACFKPAGFPPWMIV